MSHFGHRRDHLFLAADSCVSLSSKSRRRTPGQYRVVYFMAGCCRACTIETADIVSV